MNKIIISILVHKVPVPLCNEKIKIRVKFFEKVKQPYNTNYPFAIIESIVPNQ